MKLFLDCDGVLANFDKFASELFGMAPRDFEDKYGTAEFWKQLLKVEELFFKLDLMEDAMLLYDAVKHLNPTILTGIPNSMPSARHDKERWVLKHFGPNQEVITCLSKNKSHYMEKGKKNIIVDDWPKHSQKWIDKGGIWVHHTSAEDSIKQLKDLGVSL